MKILIVATAIALGSCTSKSKSVEALNPPDTLRVALGAEPSSLDWTFAADGISNEIFLNIMEGLTRFDISKPDLPLISALAESWKVSADGKTYEFQIRKNVLWSDQTPLIAQHFVDGFEKALNPQNASNYCYLLFPVLNAREFNAGKFKDFSKVGIKAEGASKLRITLEKPAAFFLNVLALPISFPVRRDLIERHGPKWTEASNMISLGPFSLKEWQHDSKVVLERSPTYWGTKAKLFRIEMYIIPQDSTALTLFETGRLDYLHYLPAAEIPRFRGKPEFRQVNTPGIIYLGFNLKSGRLKDVKLRRAIVHSLDRNEIAAAASAGRLPFKGWVPPGILGHAPDVGLDFDIQKAKTLVKEALSENRTSWPKVRLLVNGDKGAQAIPENIQHQLKKNLGIEVELVPREWKIFLEEQGKNTSDIFMGGWLADYSDPDNFATLLTSDSENNRTGWKSDKYDSLVRKAAYSSDSDLRRELYLQAQRLALEEDVVVLPILLMSRTSLISQRVQNAPFNVFENYRYDLTELK